MSKHKTLTIPYELWEWLRSRAFNEKTSMVEVLRGLAISKDAEELADEYEKEAKQE